MPATLGSLGRGQRYRVQMPFSIDRVVPWGRSAAEYQAMFGLDKADLGGRILGCGDGPASFNAELSAQGRVVVSVDPLYAMSAAAIERRIERAFGEVMDQVRRNQEDFVWAHVPSIEELGRRRMTAMRRFIADYPGGKAENRYVEASLPDLPFDSGSFDLALSSHLLFLYSDQFDLDFHLRALEEMLRVAPEVRVFPLLQIGGTASPHVEAIVDAFESRGAVATVEMVAYEFQKGGNRMLRLGWKQKPCKSDGSCAAL